MQTMQHNAAGDNQNSITMEILNSGSGSSNAGDQRHFAMRNQPGVPVTLGAIGSEPSDEEQDD